MIIRMILMLIVEIQLWRWRPPAKDRQWDGVTIAARMQELAEPSGICVIGRIPEEVRHRELSAKSC
jgi:hypothetical protein